MKAGTKAALKHLPQELKRRFRAGLPDRKETLAEVTECLEIPENQVRMIVQVLSTARRTSCQALLSKFKGDSGCQLGAKDKGSNA